MTKILIFLEGGNVSRAVANGHIEYMVIDHDPQSDQPLMVFPPCPAEAFSQGELKECFKGEDYFNRGVREELDRADF